MQERNCVVCDKPYRPVRIRQWTCSGVCYRKRRHRMLLEKKRQARQRACIVCDKSFDGIRGAQTCSIACYRQQPEIRARVQASNRRFYANQDPESRRRRANLRKYQLSEAEYDELLTVQDGRCAICSREPEGNGTSTARLHVDHDHDTGAVRGLLCTRCNPGLGYFQNDPELLLKAATYLKERLA